MEKKPANSLRPTEGKENARRRPADPKSLPTVQRSQNPHLKPAPSRLRAAGAAPAKTQSTPRFAADARFCDSGSRRRTMMV